MHTDLARWLATNLLQVSAGQAKTSQAPCHSTAQRMPEPAKAVKAGPAHPEYFGKRKVGGVVLRRHEQAVRGAGGDAGGDGPAEAARVGDGACAEGRCQGGEQCGRCVTAVPAGSWTANRWGCCEHASVSLCIEMLRGS